MATSALIPVSEYLSTSYEPDCDYVDGEIQERNVGDLDHSDLQAQLLELLRTPANKQFVRATTELRLQVKEARFRVPDICVRSVDAPREQIVQTSPLLCIEVLSPEDRMSRTLVKVRDYLEMGIPEVWVVDKDLRSVLVCKGPTTVAQTTGELHVPRTPIAIALADIFKVLDEY
jgi:Uma2 family endonuclease